MVTDAPGGQVRLVDFQSHDDRVEGFEQRARDDLLQLGRIARSLNLGPLDGVIPYLLGEDGIPTAAGTVARCDAAGLTGGGR
jgi:hypothetical protein